MCASRYALGSTATSRCLQRDLFLRSYALSDTMLPLSHAFAVLDKAPTIRGIKHAVSRANAIGLEPNRPKKRSSAGFRRTAGVTRAPPGHARRRGPVIVVVVIVVVCVVG